MAWLRLAAPAVLAAMAAAAAGQPSPAAPAGQVGAETIALGHDLYRRLTVPVTIGGEGPFRFMVDTGAQATVLSRALADRLQLFGRERATLVGMASRREVEIAAVPELSVGRRSVSIAGAPLVDGGNIGGADGILGLDSLQDQRVLIDFERQEMVVADAEVLGGNRGFEIVVRARRRLGQLIITRARLDGVEVAVIVDTGAQGSMGNQALFAKLRRARHLGDTSLTDINGVVMGGAVRMGGVLDLGRARLSNLPIMFAPSPTFAALGLADEPALILGMEELKLFDRVAIDFASRRVLFDLPPGTRFD